MWGASSTKVRRFVSSSYADGRGEPRGGRESRLSHCDTGNKQDVNDCNADPKAKLPNPRTVSFTVHTDVPEKKDSDRTVMLIQFGQFLGNPVRDILNTGFHQFDLAWTQGKILRRMGLG